MKKKMRKIRFRIFDALSRDVSTSLSIRGITNRIRELHGIAHYKNIYTEIQKLQEEGLVEIKKAGKASMVHLRFDHPQLADFLVQVELEKKQKAIYPRKDLTLVVSNVLDDLYPLKTNVLSILGIDLEKNSKLNRMELIILISNTTVQMQREILLKIKQLHSRFNMKIDPLLLTEESFFHLLATQDLNPVKEMFWYKTILFNPHTFWMMVRRHLKRDQKIESSSDIRSPQEVDTTDLTYNLYRFGYTELGSKVKQGKNIALEYIVTSILLGNEARKIQAIPILLAKNEVNYNLLLFLAKKYNMEGKLLGLLQTLEKVKKTKVISNTIRTMTMMEIKAKPVAEKSILQKMKMYNVY